MPSVPVGATLVEQVAEVMDRSLYHTSSEYTLRHAAEAVLAVAAPLLRAEGAAAERERIKAGIEAEIGGWDSGVPATTVERVLAVVSREAEASE